MFLARIPTLELFLIYVRPFTLQLGIFAYICKKNIVFDCMSMIECPRCDHFCNKMKKRTSKLSTRPVPRLILTAQPPFKECVHVSDTSNGDPRSLQFGVSAYRLHRSTRRHWGRYWEKWKVGLSARRRVMTNIRRAWTPRAPRHAPAQYKWILPVHAERLRVRTWWTPGPIQTP